MQDLFSMPQDRMKVRTSQLIKINFIHDKQQYFTCDFIGLRNLKSV